MDLHARTFRRRAGLDDGDFDAAERWIDDLQRIGGSPFRKDAVRAEGSSCATDLAQRNVVALRAAEAVVDEEAWENERVALKRAMVIGASLSHIDVEGPGQRAR